MNRISKWSLLICCILPLAAFAQLGGIRGVAMDSDFEVPLPGVKVRISETGQETVTGDTGSYYLEKVEVGSYTLLFSKGGYTRFTKSEVVVSPGQLAEVEASMAGEYEEMDELVVRDIQLGGASEIGLLNLRMESSSLMDSVGAEMMSQAGASDAAQALNLVPGTTVQDGKYAVVRGLPDRYVVSLMNGVRLPTADPDKRAVQLDQFPSALIESIQVSKTFTPDQQGDASGGAVNVVLKSMPEEPVLKFKVGTKYKTAMADDGEFLTYNGGGLNYWGTDDDRKPQTAGTDWSGAVGTKGGDASPMYDWSITAGGKYDVTHDLRVSALGNFYYKTESSHIDGKTDDKWWFRNGEMVPVHSEEDPLSGNPDDPSGKQFKTSLFDVQQSTEEVQWGGLGAFGIETDEHSLSLIYMQTHVAEDKAVLAEDTRGKNFYVTAKVPGYDPYATGDNDDYNNAAPFRRNQTLEYTERDTSTLQLHGEHVIPVPEFGWEGILTFLEPKLDWTVAGSDSEMKTPDKRLFGSLWIPGYETIVPGNRGAPATTNTVASGYYQDKPPVSVLGNLQRVWEEVYEESQQYFLNGQLPFRQWSDEEGYFKSGFFLDKVKRTYKKDSYSNFGDAYAGPSLGWDEYWSDVFPSESHLVQAAEIDTDYEGEQDLSAWYWMMELPLSSFMTVVGGARYEKTDLSIKLIEPEDEVYWVKPGEVGLSKLLPGEGDVDYEQDDVLPSLGIELRPHKTLSLRASYSETVARQTFKELTPIQQQEYLGADVFIGNPALEMSALENFDLRFDYAPYPGGLVSGSWFRKNVDKPIEYTQGYAGNVGNYITPVNYPEGELTGYEIEFRQQLGQFWNPLEGITFGANATFIDSEVTLNQKDASDLATAGYAEPKRDMLNAPEYLYNINLTYDIKKFGTTLGLFYIVKGDTLVAGSSTDIGYIPNVYEKEFDTLNFTVTQKLGDHITVSFKAKNLTDPEIKEVYRSDYIGKDVDKTSYKKGLEYSLGISSAW